MGIIGLGLRVSLRVDVDVRPAWSLPSVAGLRESQGTCHDRAHECFIDEAFFFYADRRFPPTLYL